ncbi:MAG TPA: MarR family transcriptional regulator [Archaeoglobus veneficus]|nr:MarR family transcriptional regulator [Archaeoglobus veneficus]
MAEAEEKPKKAKKELTVKKLREKGVKPREEVIEKSKEQRKIIKQITECLKAGPKTIPEIASEVKMPVGVVTWYVMTMFKYGQVEPDEEVGGYYKYKLAVKEGVEEGE